MKESAANRLHDIHVEVAISVDRQIAKTYHALQNVHLHAAYATPGDRMAVAFRVGIAWY